MSLPENFVMFFEGCMGSRAYGTHRPDSDYDWRGVGMHLSEDYYFGFKRFNVDQSMKGEDRTVYDIRKFIELAMEGNPNIIEILYLDDPNLIKSTSDAWENIIKPNRGIFLTKRARHKYKGFAMAQKARMERHRKWIINPPPEPKVEDFFLKEWDPNKDWHEGILLKYDKNRPESREFLTNFLNQLEGYRRRDNILTAKLTEGRVSLTFKTKETEEQGKIFDKDSFDAAIKEFSKYKTWRENRNPARFALEEKYGYDTKHAVHAIRLMDQLKDILLIGGIWLSDCNNVEHWRAILRGKYSYDEFIGIFQERIDGIDEWEEKSTLPAKPDARKIEDLTIQIVKETLKTI
jgi:predicted nucleotidyltransferase